VLDDAEIFAALSKRYTRSFTFRELRRAVQALSTLYVERRKAANKAFDSDGKRAAFALYYGTLHFLTVREVVSRLPNAIDGFEKIVDLGCGTGIAGAAWALCADCPATLGVERDGWAVGEARWTQQLLGLSGRVYRGDATQWRLPGSGSGVLAAYVINELDDEGRQGLQNSLLDAASRGATILILEPVARRVAPWWPQWAERFEDAGGRNDTWSLSLPFPDWFVDFDRATGLNHAVVKARSLFLRGK